MEYSAKISELFENTRNAGTLLGENVYEVTTYGSLPTNFVKLYLLIDASSTIEQAKYQVSGCPVTIACCETLVNLIQGKSVSFAENINYLNIVDGLQVPDLKLHCAIQVEEALHRVLTKYLKQS